MPKTHFTFTGKTLAELPAPDTGRVCFYDAAQPGLQLEITAAGATSFRVYRKFKGRPVKITLGRFDPDLPETRDLPEGAKPLDLLGNSPALNVRMAHKLAMAVIAQLDTGVDPRGSKARRGLTLGEVFDRYRAQLVAEGRKSAAGVVWCYEKYLGVLPDGPRKAHGRARVKGPGSVNWHTRRLSEIQHDDVSRLRLDLAEKTGRTTANRVMELLRAVFNFAKKYRLYAGENPAAGTGEFKSASRERFLQADELPAFFAALEAEIDADFRDYVKLSLYTGARRSNLLQMKWADVNLEGGRWTVAGELMKNGEPLTIELVKQAIALLRNRAKHRADDAVWVFPGDTKAGHVGAFRKPWKRLTKQAGLTDLHVHDLRRSLGSWMAGSGASTVLTMRALGHKSIAAALVYQQLATVPVRNAMQTAVAAISRAAKTKKRRAARTPRKPQRPATGK
jgi:integrase